MKAITNIQKFIVVRSDTDSYIHYPRTTWDFHYIYLRIQSVCFPIGSQTKTQSVYFSGSQTTQLVFTGSPVTTFTICLFFGITNNPTGFKLRLTSQTTNPHFVSVPYWKQSIIKDESNNTNSQKSDSCSFSTAGAALTSFKLSLSSSSSMLQEI